MRVAFQGERGANSEAALAGHFGPGAEPVPCPSFERIYQAVNAGEVEAGLIPIENSLAGSILENYDLLTANELPIVGEVMLRVRHFLMARPGTELEDVKLAYSHPQALAQSLPFLKQHGIEARAAYDTAGAAKDLAGRSEPGAAAIAPARAAEIYGLDIVAADIQTRGDNTTRFFIIAKERPQDLPCEKASLVFAAPNTPGSLFGCLEAFAKRGLNLTKLESRPSLKTPWEYLFYVDFERGDKAPFEAGELEGLLGEMRGHMELVRLLGCYPRAGRVI